MGITVAGVAAAATAASAAVGAANFIAGQVGGGGSATGGGQGSGGGLTVMQTQLANSVGLNKQPVYGGSKEPSQMNPDMPLNNKAPSPERAASKWNINSTPTQAVGDEQAKQVTICCQPTRI